MTQSSWGAVVARIKNRIETVANVGKVHDHLELATSADELKAIGMITLNGQDRIRLWMVHLEQMPSTWSEQGAVADWLRTVQIEGFFQFEAAGAAEKDAIAVAEGIIRALNADLKATPPLGGTVLSGGPVVLLESNPRAFGPLLVHYIRLSAQVLTIET